MGISACASRLPARQSPSNIKYKPLPYSPCLQECDVHSSLSNVAAELGRGRQCMGTWLFVERVV